ncbi:MAG: hypothetical protein ACOC70_02470 [bacterium]
MDPLRQWLALGPVAVYLIVLGGVNLSRRPLVVSGARDAAALAVAVSGLVAVGPLELFVPAAAVIRYGGYVWALLAGFYVTVAAMTLLLMRPRLVVYNIKGDQLRPLLADVARRLDARGRWAGDSLSLPTLGVQLHMDNYGWMRNVSLTASGGRQDPLGWRRLERELAGELAQMPRSRNPRGHSLITAGVLIFAWLVVNVWDNPAGVGQSLIDLLRL